MQNRNIPDKEEIIQFVVSSSEKTNRKIETFIANMKEQHTFPENRSILSNQKSGQEGQ